MLNIVVQEDNGTIIDLTIRDKNGIVNLTNSAVEIRLSSTKSGSKDFTATITDAVNGKCQIVLASADIAYEGTYSLQATVKYTSGKVFSSLIEKLYVSVKLGTITGTIGNVTVTTITTSGTNGNIKVNGIELKVYDDATLKSDISDLKNSKHAHTNMEDLNRLGINENGNLTVDGVELQTSPSGSLIIDGGTFTETEYTRLINGGTF